MTFERWTRETGFVLKLNCQEGTTTARFSRNSTFLDSSPPQPPPVLPQSPLHRQIDQKMCENGTGKVIILSSNLLHSLGHVYAVLIERIRTGINMEFVLSNQNRARRKEKKNKWFGREFLLLQFPMWPHSLIGGDYIKFIQNRIRINRAEVEEINGLCNYLVVCQREGGREGANGNANKSVRGKATQRYPCVYSLLAICGNRWCRIDTESIDLLIGVVVVVFTSNHQ